jgi:hypothetical protein
MFFANYDDHLSRVLYWEQMILNRVPTLSQISYLAVCKVIGRNGTSLSEMTGLCGKQSVDTEASTSLNTHNADEQVKSNLSLDWLMSKIVCD